MLYTEEAGDQGHYEPCIRRSERHANCSGTFLRESLALPPAMAGGASTPPQQPPHSMSVEAALLEMEIRIHRTSMPPRTGLALRRRHSRQCVTVPDVPVAAVGEPTVDLCTPRSLLVLPGNAPVVGLSEACNPGPSTAVGINGATGGNVEARIPIPASWVSASTRSWLYVPLLKPSAGLTLETDAWYTQTGIVRDFERAAAYLRSSEPKALADIHPGLAGVGGGRTALREAVLRTLDSNGYIPAFAQEVLLQAFACDARFSDVLDYIEQQALRLERFGPAAICMPHEHGAPNVSRSVAGAADETLPRLHPGSQRCVLEWPLTYHQPRTSCAPRRLGQPCFKDSPQAEVEQRSHQLPPGAEG